MRVDPQKYGESILLAVSGGVDSMVMATAFLESGMYRRLLIAHCNFHLRGEESDADTLLVKEWAASNGVECLIRDFDTISYASEKGISIEMAARELRYRWFDELCSSEGFSGVCVAHNADDNAETLMLNLLRGTGMRGICAMKEVSPSPFGQSMVFRPLLSFSRSEIMSYALRKKVPYRTDSTNLECDCKRNLLRNKVFPLLKEINPSMLSTLGRDIAHFNGAAAIVEDYLREHDVVSGDEIRIRELLASPHWKYLLYGALSARGFNESTFDDVVSLLEGGGIIGGKTFKSPDTLLVSTSSSLLFKPLAAGKAAECRIETLSWEKGMDPRTERGVTLLDAEALMGSPHVRMYQEGDYLQPIGMKGKKKVSDLLTDLKYDVVSKRSALVVESPEGGRHVAALVGERVDRSYAVTPSTKRVYRISIL